MRILTALLFLFPFFTYADHIVFKNDTLLLHEQSLKDYPRFKYVDKRVSKQTKPVSLKGNNQSYEVFWKIENDSLFLIAIRVIKFKIDSGKFNFEKGSKANLYNLFQKDCTNGKVFSFWVTDEFKITNGHHRGLRNLYDFELRCNIEKGLVKGKNKAYDIFEPWNIINDNFKIFLPDHLKQNEDLIDNRYHFFNNTKKIELFVKIWNNKGKKKTEEQIQFAKNLIFHEKEVLGPEYKIKLNNPNVIMTSEYNYTWLEADGALIIFIVSNEKKTISFTLIGRRLSEFNEYKQQLRKIMDSVVL